MRKGKCPRGAERIVVTIGAFNTIVNLRIVVTIGAFNTIVNFYEYVAKSLRDAEDQGAFISQCSFPGL